MLRLLAITAGVAMAANVEVGLPGLRAPRRRPAASAGSNRSEKKAKKRAAYNQKRKLEDETTLAEYYDANYESLRDTDFTTEFGRDCTNIKGGVTDWKKKCKTLARENTWCTCFYDYVGKFCRAGPGTCPGSTSNSGGVAGQGR